MRSILRPAGETADSPTYLCPPIRLERLNTSATHDPGRFFGIHILGHISKIPSRGDKLKKAAKPFSAVGDTVGSLSPHRTHQLVKVENFAITGKYLHQSLFNVAVFDKNWDRENGPNSALLVKKRQSQKTHPLGEAEAEKHS